MTYVDPVKGVVRVPIQQPQVHMMQPGVHIQHQVYMQQPGVHIQQQIPVHIQQHINMQHAQQVHNLHHIQHMQEFNNIQGVSNNVSTDDHGIECVDSDTE